MNLLILALPSELTFISTQVVSTQVKDVTVILTMQCKQWGIRLRMELSMLLLGISGGLLGVTVVMLKSSYSLEVLEFVSSM